MLLFLSLGIATSIDTILFFHSLNYNLNIQSCYEILNYDEEIIKSKMKFHKNICNNNDNPLKHIEKDDLKYILAEYFNYNKSILHQIINEITNKNEIDFKKNDNILKILMKGKNFSESEIKKISEMGNLIKKKLIIKYYVIYNNIFYTIYSVNDKIYLVCTKFYRHYNYLDNKNILYKALLEYEYLLNCDHVNITNIVNEKIKRIFLSVILNNLEDKKYLNRLIDEMEFLNEIYLKNELYKILNKTKIKHYTCKNIDSLFYIAMSDYLIFNFMIFSKNDFNKLADVISAIKRVLNEHLMNFKKLEKYTIDSEKKANYFNLKNLKKIYLLGRFKTTLNAKLSDIYYISNILHQNNFVKYNIKQLFNNFHAEYLTFFNHFIFTFSHYFWYINRLYNFEKKCNDFIKLNF